MNTRTISSMLLFLALPLCFVADAGGDDLFIASGNRLNTSQRSFIENRMKGLRDGNPDKRFESIQYLIGLNQIAPSLLASEIKDNPNPMLVRCAILALSEIGGPDVSSLLVKVAASKSDFGRDERMIAALGLGKLDETFDVAKLRSLIESRENLFLRKTAALALARKKDAPAVRKLIKWATKEKEEELVSALLLSAFMIGGEEVIKEVPKLFRNLKYRRPVMALGAAFLGDPVILPELLKYGARDEKVRKALAVTLGRYRSPEALVLLGKLISSDDIDSAEHALYSLAFQDEEKSRPSFERALKSSEPSIRKHGILALADSRLAAQFMEDFTLLMMKDVDPSVRSAGALALKNSERDDTVMQLAEALKTEQVPEVVADLLLVLGLMGGNQHKMTAVEWHNRSNDGYLAWAAEMVAKVMDGKMDSRILEEMYEDRLSTESGRWHYRLRDMVMLEVYEVLELDNIMRKNQTSGSNENTGSGGGDNTSGESGSDDVSGGGDETGGSGDEGGNATGDDNVTPPQGTTGDGGNGQKKKFNFRWDVVEWDIKNWFDYYPYFPDAFFMAGN